MAQAVTMATSPCLAGIGTLKGQVGSLAQGLGDQSGSRYRGASLRGEPGGGNSRALVQAAKRAGGTTRGREQCSYTMAVHPRLAAGKVVINIQREREIPRERTSPSQALHYGGDSGFDRSHRNPRDRKRI